MKRVRTSLFFVAVLGVLALGGSAWGVESSEQIQGMISHWKFDEGSGTIAYDSAGDNDGTVYGAVWTTGQVGGALDFDGVDDYVALQDNAVTTTEFTVSAWANHYGLGGGRFHTNAIFCQRDDLAGDNRSAITICTENTDYYPYATAAIRGSSGSVQQLTYPKKNYNQWHHYAMTVNPSDFIFYIDGVEVNRTSNNQTGDYVTSIDYVNIGRHRYNGINGGFFNGTIDEVRIYNGALSPEEIWQIYQGELADLVGLEIIGPGEVAENFSASYKAIAYYDDDSTRDVTSLVSWSVEPNTVASIDENGVLTTKDIVKHQSATILASYTEGDVTFDAEKAIDILAICPTGTALQFDGVDDYVDCGNDASLDLGSGSFTLAAWVKTSVTNEFFDRIVSHYCGGYPGHRQTVFLDLDGSHHAQVWIRDNVPNQAKVTGTTNIEDGKWHYVVGVRDGNTLYLYVNGTLEGTPADAGAVGDVVGPAPWTIGAAKDYRGILYTHYNGIIDEVAIYNRALSAEEIQANMHRRLAGDEPGLVGYWDFDEGEGQIVYDLSGSGNDGQLGSTPNPDVSDPAWIESDAPIGICSLYQIATRAADGVVERKTSLIEELLAGLIGEWTAYEVLEELLESGDYGDLDKGSIVKAKQKIHSATQHEEQSIGALDKSIEKLIDALNALGYEPEPLPPPPGQATNPNPANGATNVSISADLSWTAGSNAVSHNVYFGTTSPGTFRGNQTATTFDPGTMAYSTTYYWRIDEVNASGTTTGTVWSFTTTSGGGPPPI